MPDAVRTPELAEINPPVPFLDGVRQVWRNVVEHRHLITNFIQRDIRLKYRDSAFGYFWSLLEPLLLSAIYFVLYIIVAGKPSPMYPLWVVLGVMTWSFFSKGLADSLTCLTGNEGMIKQVYIPREIFAITSISSSFIMTALSLLVAVPLMIIYRLPPTPYLLMVPVGLILAAMLALGVGLGLACANVVTRDVEFFFRFVTRGGMFISPVMWTVDMAPRSRAPWIEYLLLNPIAVPITMVRNGITGKGLDGIDGIYVAYSVGFCLLSFVLGTLVFKRFEGSVIKKL